MRKRDNMQMNLTTAAGLTAATSVILTTVMLLIPQTRRWFTALDADTQKSVRGIVVIALAIVFVAGGCAGVIASAPACSVQSIGDYALGVVLAAVMSLGSTDGVFLVARKLRDRSTAPKLRMIPSTGSPPPGGGSGQAGAPVGKLF